MKDCVNVVFTEVFEEVTSKEGFVIVISMEAFAKSFVELTSM